MTTWKAICSVEDIPALGARRVARPVGLDVESMRMENCSCLGASSAHKDARDFAPQPVSAVAS